MDVLTYDHVLCWDGNVRVLLFCFHFGVFCHDLRVVVLQGSDFELRCSYLHIICILYLYLRSGFVGMFRYQFPICNTLGEVFALYVEMDSNYVPSLDFANWSHCEPCCRPATTSGHGATGRSCPDSQLVATWLVGHYRLVTRRLVGYPGATN